MASSSSSLFLLLTIFLSLQFQLQVLSLSTRVGVNDFSYMKSVYNASDLPVKEKYYDYIVIGGGTAGCPLAATLSEKYSVLLLERGNVPSAHPSVLQASAFLANILAKDDGDTPAQPFSSEDGTTSARGRVLGGTSMINGGFYSRGDPAFFANSGVEWHTDSVEKAFEWVEETIVFRGSLSDWQSVAKQAMLEAGLGPDNGFTVKHKIGTKVSGSTFDQVGIRHGAVELLNKGNLTNLRIAIHATVERIIFNDKTSAPSATGVIYIDSKGKSHKALVRNKGEIILSAGALGSPQLLLLSGIGPRSYLSSLHIPIVHSQPNVGKFMADNPRNMISIVTPFPLDPGGPQAAITSDYYIEAINYNLPLVPVNISVAAFINKIWGPFSYGSLRLASPVEVKTTPRVRFNYFSNPKDLSHCVSAMRKFGEILRTRAIEQFKYKDLKGERGFMFLGPSLPKNESDDSSMEAFCRSTVTSFYHYHGGCLVGKVVDGDFRVKGIKSLRVVDGSTFTASPGTNPQATLMMLGRYIGLKMLQERREFN